MDQIFREDIVWLDQEFESQESFYREIADRLYKKGLVKETFGQALIDREAVFPTGLKTETFEIAIPHTDVEHVEEVFIAVVRFKTPIPYAHMGEPGICICFRNQRPSKTGGSVKYFSKTDFR